MKTDDLIHKLSQNVQPVKAPAKPVVFALQGSLLAFVIIVFSIAVLNLRGDLFSVYYQKEFLFQLVGFLGLLFCGLTLVSWLSSPERKTASGFLFAVLFFLIVAVASNVFGVSFLSHDHLADGMNLSGYKCTAITFLVSFVTGVVFFLRARTGAPRNPALMGMIVGLAALGSGGLAITLHCDIGNAMHIAIWHFAIPLLGVGLLGFAFGRKFLHW